MRKLVIALNAVVALTLLYWFFSSLDWRALAAALSRANLFWLAPAVFCYALMNWSSAVRLKQLLSLPISTAKTFFIHMQALLLSDVTPGRAGYAYLLVGLRKHCGGSVKESGRILGIVLASDFFVRAALIIASIALFAQGFLAAGVFLAAFSALALFFFWRRTRFVEKMLRAIPFAGERLSAAYEEVFVKHVGKRELLFSLFISLFGAVARGVAWWLVLYALGFNASLTAFIVLCALLTSLSFIPLSVAGLGVQEATGAFLFSSLLAIPVAAAGGLMILVRVLEAGTDLALGLKEFVARN